MRLKKEEYSMPGITKVVFLFRIISIAMEDRLKINK